MKRVDLFAVLFVTLLCVFALGAAWGTHYPCKQFTDHVAELESAHKRDMAIIDDWRTDALFWKECSGWWRTNSDFWIAETTECETNYNDAVASFYRQRDEMDKAVAAAEFLKEAADGFLNAALKDNGIERLGALQKVIEKLKAEHPGWETNDLSSGATFPSSQGVYLARGQTRTETESCRARISSAPRPALPCLDELVWRGRDDDCAGQDAMGTVWTERRARYFRCD